MLPDDINLGSICCGVVPDGLFPGQLVFGRTLFHAFGICTQENGDVKLLRAKTEPILKRIDNGTVFVIENAMPKANDKSLEIVSLIKNFQQKYSPVFRFNPENPQQTVHETTVQHYIDTGLSNPVKIPARRYSPAQCKAINDFLRMAIKRKLIRKSKSPWAAPAVLAPKKGGAWRFCIDYRQLNSITKKHAFPLPNIQDELQKAAGKNYYCSFDLIDGFWHIAMAPSSVEKTAFTVPNGIYEWLVMPFGLTNAPSTFQSFINEVLEPLRDVVAGMLDDVCTWGNSIEECAANAERVLKRFADFNLILNVRKCRAVLERPPPTTTTEIRSFLNAAGYLRDFVAGFAVMASPLYSLTGGEKNGYITLNAAQLSSWNAIKTAITSLPVLKPFNFNSISIIDCDASKEATGGVLLQPHPYQGNTRNDDKTLLQSPQIALYPVAYMSHKFTATQQRYSAQERELVAVVLCLQHWRYWVEGSEIIVRTDHESLTGYRTKTVGITNVLPDFLSRPPFPPQTSTPQVFPKNSYENPDDSTEIESNMGDINETLGAVNAESITDEDELAIDNLSRIDLHAIFEALRSRSPLPRRLVRFSNDFITRNNKLYYIENNALKEVPDHEILLDKAISTHKNIGHATAGILIAELRQYYWHPDIVLIGQEAIRTCERCQLLLAPNTSSLLLQPIPPALPLQRWGIDFTGPILGYQMLNAIDYATGYAISQLCSNTSHKVIIDFINNLIHISGVPAEMVSDNGSSFVAAETRAFLKRFDIKYYQTTPYHPRTNGRCERFNGTIKKIWTSVWAESVQLTAVGALQKALHIYNTRPSENGYSPHFLLFGVVRKLANPVPISFYVREQTEEENQALVSDLANRRKEQINMIRQSINSVKATQSHIRSLLAERKAFTRSFAKGVWVLRQRQRKHKFEPFYDGPFSIIGCHRGNTYTLMTPGGIVMANKYNGSRLFPAYQRENQPIRSLWYASNRLLKQDRDRIAREAGL
ncbi:hypothetical protein K3495_g11539 [Podosphaera aphanis]|nr:hypothetical protein K3495_g11539 [Podosphaera aphanis]